jgi:dolichol kinase
MKTFKKRVVPAITNSSKDYKTPIKEILSSSSLSYLLSPIRSKRLVIKIIWIIFLIGFLFGSIYYVVLNVLDYLQYETTTSIYEVNEQEAEFPTVSFCNTKNSNFDLKIIGFWFQNEDLTDEWQNHFESYADTAYGNCHFYLLYFKCIRILL